MQTNKLLYSLALTVAVLVGIAQPVSAVNLVVNGGFETGDFTGWTQTGNTGFTSVSGIFGGVSPHDGSFQAAFGPVGSLGGIEQTLAGLTPGETYTIGFWLHHFGGIPSEIRVSWGGSVVLDVVNPAASAYTEYSFNVVAGGPTVSLEFRQDPSFFLLDDVSVTAAAASVPDAGSTLALLGFGLLACLAGRRFVRRASAC